MAAISIGIHRRSFRRTAQVQFAPSATTCWIELYNVGPDAVDLTGFQLVRDDRPESPHPLPSGMQVPARGFMLLPLEVMDLPVFNGTTSQTQPNTGMPCTIQLINPDGMPVDAMPVYGLVAGCSQARLPDGSATIYQLRPPTPNASNSLEDPDEPVAVLTEEYLGSGRTRLS